MESIVLTDPGANTVLGCWDEERNRRSLHYAALRSN
jgi:hypothetical protein